MLSKTSKKKVIVEKIAVLKNPFFENIKNAI